jgi:hypothetical protein
MARYLADVWLGVDSGFQSVEIDASSINGVTEQIVTRYHVRKEDIRNIRITTKLTETEGASNSGVFLLAMFILFALFPSSFLMILFGTSGTWLSLRLFGKSFWKIKYPQFIIVTLIAILSGSTGFFIGHQIEQPTQQIHRNQ